MRRACSDKRLAELEKRSTGRDSASHWLRKCRRTITPTSRPVGERSKQQQKYADRSAYQINFLKFISQERHTIIPI